MKPPCLLLHLLLLLLLPLCASAMARSEHLQLRVFNLRAENLPGEYLGLGHTDAYVRVLSQDELVGVTSVRKNDNNPWWKDTFRCSVLERSTLTLEVHDKDKFSQDDLVGTCQTLVHNNTAQTECGTRQECELKKGGKLYYEYTLG